MGHFVYGGIKMRKLPVVLQSEIVSECWTFYKMAVIQTHPRLEEWFASKRLDVFLSENGSHSCFGEYGAMYPLSYYGDILHISEVQDPNPIHIVDRIERGIDAGQYTIVYLNFTTLFNDTMHESPYIHEMLIYGYDESRRVFYCAHVGKEYELAYDLFLENYTGVWDLFRREPELLFPRRMWYFLVTSISLNLDYHNDNACYDFLKKVEREWKVGTVIKNEYSKWGEKENQIVYHCGIYALLALRDKLLWMRTQSPTTDECYTYSLIILKFCEHRSILLRSMAWFMEHNGFLNEEKTAVPMRACYGRYEKCVIRMKKIHALFLKYSLVKSPAICIRVIDCLQAQYALEYEALEAFYQKAIEFYH